MGEEPLKLLLLVPPDLMDKFNMWWRTSRPDIRNVSEAIRQAMDMTTKTKPVATKKTKA